MKLRRKKFNNSFFKEREREGGAEGTKNQYLWELFKKGALDSSQI